MALMKIKIDRYQSFDKAFTRSLSYDELISLPIGTLVSYNNDIYTYKGRSPDKRYYEAVSSVSPCSYYIKNNNYEIFPLPSDSKVITSYEGNIFTQEVTYRQSSVSTYQYVFSWSNLSKNLFLINEKMLSSFIEPYVPMLDCFSSALQENIDLGLTA